MIAGIEKKSETLTRLPEYLLESEECRTVVWWMCTVRTLASWGKDGFHRRAVHKKGVKLYVMRKKTAINFWAFS